MKKAFTLIELLVVVGIIGLLLMLLLPALGVARDRGHEALCKNRIRSLAIAAMAYEQDFGYLPTAEAWTPVAQFSLTDLGTVTNTVFYSYVDTPEPYLCPSFKRNAPWRNAVRSYSMNAAVTQDYPDVPPELIIRKSTTVHAPSELVLFAEENWFIARLNPPYNCIVNDGRLLWWPAFYNDSIGTFHRNNSCMFAFIDGHVEPYTHQPDWRNKFDVRLYRP
jgi:prepilin-type N-terminal cleavage/methylation domain-containing protein/prepilin-type processing-associated H-X9-DG protein